MSSFSFAEALSMPLQIMESLQSETTIQLLPLPDQICPQVLITPHHTLPHHTLLAFDTCFLHVNSPLLSLPSLSPELPIPDHHGPSLVARKHPVPAQQRSQVQVSGATLLVLSRSSHTPSLPILSFLCLFRCVSAPTATMGRVSRCG